jgi:hypothetical protein
MLVFRLACANIILTTGTIIAAGILVCRSQGVNAFQSRAVTDSGIKLQHLVQHDHASNGSIILHLHSIWACEEITAFLCVAAARLVWKLRTSCSGAFDLIFVCLVKRVQ